MDKKTMQKFKDPYWRLTNLYHIKTKRGEVILFNPKKAQKKYLQEETHQDIILKSRQMGFSTLKLVQLLDRTMFTPNTTSVILAHRRESVQKLFRIIKFAYDRYPNKYPKPSAKYDNRNELYFDEINSSIYVATEVRGDTVTNLHISELAFTTGAENAYIATKAALVPGGRLTIESTANGIGNFFYDFWQTAEDRGYKKHFFPWYWDPDYSYPADGVKFTKEHKAMQKRHNLTDEQLAWWVINKSDFKAKMEQEYPSTPTEAFLTSGNNVFPVQVLKQIETYNPLAKDEDGLKIWERPKYGRKYAIGVDVANDGQDRSSLDIIDLKTGVQVAHYNARVLIPLYAQKIIHWAKLYNNALIIPEANNHGLALINIISEHRPRLKIYKREKFDTIKRRKTKKLGWVTSARTKAIMVQDLITALYEEGIQIRNEETISEMMTFVQDLESGKMNAASGKYDDRVISICLAWQGFKKRPEENLTPYDSFTIGDTDGIAY